LGIIRKKTGVGEDVKNGNLVHGWADMDMKLFSHCGKQFRGILQKLNTGLP
jgi:hypothetical protein